MNNKNLKDIIIYIDMDDTICNFTKGFNTLKTDKIQFPQSQYGFFTNLEPIDGAIEAVKYLSEYFDVMILSRPSYLNPLCYTEKRIWVEKYFGLSFCENLILSSRKHLSIGDYLIDDVYHKGFQGEQLLFGDSSLGFDNWNKIINYFKCKYSLYNSNFEGTIEGKYLVLTTDNQLYELRLKNIFAPHEWYRNTEGIMNHINGKEWVTIHEYKQLCDQYESLKS